MVDDADDLRDLYADVLTAEGYEIRTAALAEMALDIARSWRPDLVLTDLFMPGIGGLELITVLRSDFTPPIPRVIAISGFPEARAEALSRGAERFEAKPIGLRELVRVVEDAFAGYGARPFRSERIVSERRAATRVVGEAILARHLTEDPDFFERIHSVVPVVSKFFDHPTVLVFFLRNGRLELIATTDPTLALGKDASEVLPIVNDVVESESSLVVKASVSRWLVDYRGARDVQFLVAAPCVLDNAAVGVFCLVDEVPHEFGSGALSILEDLTRRVAGVIKGGPRTLGTSGVLNHDMFGAVLRGSVQTARNLGQALGFTICGVSEVPDDGSLEDVLMRLPAPHVMVGELDLDHLAAFSVAESVELVKERLLMTRALLEAHLRFACVIEIVFESPVPDAPFDAFVARGRELLACAVAESRAFMAMDCRRR